MNILALQKKLLKLPFGQALFSYVVARNAPYFLSIKPRILHLAPHRCEVRMRKRWRVQNHIKTVHAIAMCNMAELAGGMCIEVTIPREFRWIPAGMEVSYLKKAETDLIATCELPEIDWPNTKEVICPVSITNTEGVEVMSARIRMYISAKKPRKARPQNA
ncbi:MAG: hotdog fold domain-containing protein [Bacteroidota bacterium]